MKIFSLFALLLSAALVAHAQPPPMPQPPNFSQRLTQLSPGAPAKEAVNYLIRVNWKVPKEDPKFLEILTADGSFNLNTIQKNSVKINNNDVPVTLKFSGTLTTLDDKKGRLQLFLGRTIPYVTGTYGNGPMASSSYSQMSVGLDSTFVVKFGESQVVQSDENGDISVLVKRVD